MSMPDTLNPTAADTLAQHPAWCVACDPGAPGSAQPADVLAVIAHAGPSGAEHPAWLSREDTLVLDPDGGIRYRVGPVRITIDDNDGRPMTTEQARALADAIRGALDRM